MRPLSPPNKTVRIIGLALVILLNLGHLIAYAKGHDTLPQLMIFITTLLVLPWLCATPGEARSLPPQTGDRLWPKASSIWPKWQLSAKAEGLIFAALMAVGVFLRLYRWESMPAGIWADELLAAANGVRIIDGTPASPFGTLPLIKEWPHWVHTFNLYSYYVVANLKIFGVNHFGIKMLSIIPGCFTLAGFYWLLREIGPKRWAIIGTLLLSFSRWHLTQARFEWDATFAVAGAVIGLAAMARALRTTRWHWMAVGGIFLGLTQFSYLASRLSAAGALGWLLAMLILGQIAYPGFRKRVATGMAVFFLAFGLSAGPVITFSLVNEDIAKARINQVSIDEKHKGEEEEAFFKNVKMYAGMFTVEGPKNARQNIPKAPLLPKAYHLLFMLGAVLCLWPGFGIKNPLSWAVLGAALMGGILSDNNESPNSHRVGLALPMAYIWITVALDWLLAALARGAESILKDSEAVASKLRLGLALTLFVTVAIPSAMDTRDYFITFGESKSHWRATRAPEQLHLAKAVRPYLQSHNVWVDHVFWDKTLELLLWIEPSERDGSGKGHFDDPAYELVHFSQRHLLPEPPDDRPILLAVHPAGKRALRQQLPHAKWEGFKDPFDRDMFFLLEVDTKRLRQARKRGVKNAKFADGDAFLTPRDLKGNGVFRMVKSENRVQITEAHIERKNALKKAPQGPLPRLALPMEWHAYLHIPEDGTYRFKLKKGGHGTRLWLDGKRISLAGPGPGTAVKLTAGKHNLLLKSTINTYSRLTLEWQAPGQKEFKVVPDKALSPRKPRGFDRLKKKGAKGRKSQPGKGQAGQKKGRGQKADTGQKDGKKQGQPPKKTTRAPAQKKNANPAQK